MYSLFIIVQLYYQAPVYPYTIDGFQNIEACTMVKEQFEKLYRDGGVVATCFTKQYPPAFGEKVHKVK